MNVIDFVNDVIFLSAIVFLPIARVKGSVQIEDAFPTTAISLNAGSNRLVGSTDSTLALGTGI